MLWTLPNEHRRSTLTVGALCDDAGVIELREIEDADLPIFWTHLREPEAKRMAAFTRPYHYDREAFDVHWAKILADSSILPRTVVADGTIVGHVATFGDPDEREVTYWIGPEHWGRGVATTALTLLLELDCTRPMHAQTAADNTGSVRVLEKCGFRVVGHHSGHALARDGEIDVVTLVLQ
jgi:RimJ/RimL family protein N-acetyltransferase